MTDSEALAYDLIGRYFAKNKALPQPENLASRFDVGIDRATQWLANFESEVNQRPPVKHRVPKLPDDPDEEPPPPDRKPSLGSRISNIANILVDSGSLWLAVLIDLVLNGIGFWIIGPDPLMKAGMVCISFIVVLFSVRAWIKRDKLLWAMLAAVAVFMDLSFVLLATDVQSQNSGIDQTMVKLDADITNDQDYLSSLENLQLTKGEGYAAQIKDARSALEKAKQDKADYQAKPSVGENHMTANKVFTAIPDAVASGRWDRWIALAVMAVVFSALQLTIISATGVKWHEPQVQH